VGNVIGGEDSRIGFFRGDKQANGAAWFHDCLPSRPRANASHEETVEVESAYAMASKYVEQPATSKSANNTHPMSTTFSLVVYVNPPTRDRTGHALSE
jgi:hypothetical protein